MKLRYGGCHSESDHDKIHALRDQRVLNMLERQNVGLDYETSEHVKEGCSNHLEKYGREFFALEQ